MQLAERVNPNPLSCKVFVGPAARIYSRRLSVRRDCGRLIVEMSIEKEVSGRAGSKGRASRA